MKSILITGASGFLGHHLVKKFLDRGDSRIIAILGRPEDKANSFPQSDLVTVLPCSALFETDFGHVDTMIHTAFSRGENLQGLTDSILLTEKVIELVNAQNIDSIINISSQGIYSGLKPGEKVKEDGHIGPDTSYGLAKLVVENFLILGCKKKYTNIRMASLSSNARFLDFFVDCVIQHKDIIVTAPHQYASIMDISDAVNGITSVEELSLSDREFIYNLGPELQYSILEYAYSANQIGQEFCLSPILVNIEDNGKEFAICMDCSKLKHQTGWFPQVVKDDMIRHLFQKRLNE